MSPKIINTSVERMEKHNNKLFVINNWQDFQLSYAVADLRLTKKGGGCYQEYPFWVVGDPSQQN